MYYYLNVYIVAFSFTILSIIFKHVNKFAYFGLGLFNNYGTLAVKLADVAMTFINCLCSNSIILVVKSSEQRK